MREGGRTSRFSRIKQRLPATDLRGPKVSAESLTRRRSNLAVADAVDFQFDSFSSAVALGSSLTFGPTRAGLASGVEENRVGVFLPLNKGEGECRGKK